MHIYMQMHIVHVLIIQVPEAVKGGHAHQYYYCPGVGESSLKKHMRHRGDVPSDNTNIISSSIRTGRNEKCEYSSKIQNMHIKK